jgi:hypothetical protein
LQITVDDVTPPAGFTLVDLPQIGSFTAVVKETGNLKNQALTSFNSISASPLLVGSFGLKSGPLITSITASDPTGSDAVYGAGDTITVRFSESTSGTLYTTKSDLDKLFAYQNNDAPISLASDYAGKWINDKTLVLTIVTPSSDTAPVIGQFQIKVKSNLLQLTDAAKTSEASTSLSPPLLGTFGIKQGPSITSITARDPFALTPLGYGSNDAISVNFSELTNKPLGTQFTKSDIDNLFSFKNGNTPATLGTSYHGVWKSASVLQITVDDVTPPAGFTLVDLPQIGSFTAVVKETGNLKNQVANSLPSTSASSSLSGVFTAPLGPTIVSITAVDPDGITINPDGTLEDGGYTNADRIIVKYSERTNTPYPGTLGLLSTSDLNNMFRFIQGGSDISLGNSYSGVWSDPFTLIITINDVQGGITPNIGEFTIATTISGGIKNDAGTSAASDSQSPVLDGNFGIMYGPIITSFIAEDPDNSDSIFSTGDTFTINFASQTNKADPSSSIAGLSKSDIDTMFAFSQPIGDDYHGRWITSSSLLIEVDDANVDIPPEIGVLQVETRDSSGIRDFNNTSELSKSIFLVTGSFGTFSQIVDVCETGEASATLPSGIIASVSSVNGCTSFTMERAVDESFAEVGRIGVLGSTIDITPQNLLVCSVDNPCQIHFIFSDDDAAAYGLLPSEVKIQHDKNHNDVLDVDEYLDTTITKIDEHLNLASASVDKFSKFAVGGINALALGSLAGSVTGGSSGSSDSNSGIFAIQSTSLVSLSGTDGGFAGSLTATDLSTISHTMYFKPQEDLMFTLGFSDIQGPSYLEHVGLYLNNVGKELKSKDYDTSIVYEKYGDPQIRITDPHGLFKTSNLKIIEKDRQHGIVQFELEFADLTDMTNMYVTMWDLDRNVSYRTFENILQIGEPPVVINPVMSEPTTVATVPDWLKTGAGWWADGTIDDVDFVQGIQYLIDHKLITVLDASSIDNGSSEIPQWVKNNAKWWSEDKISEDDFVNGIQYLVKTGILHVGSN